MATRAGARVLYVTGKGGVGKSFVAAELAHAAASRGLETALVDVAGQAFAVAEPSGDAGPRVDRITLDPRTALRHLLTRLLRFGFLSNRLMDSRTFSAVAAAAPGLRDLVYLSYVRDLADGRIGHRFDLVVVNGVASGHTIAMLEAPARVAELVAMGPAASIARATRELVADARRFRVAVVTLPEELCVTETGELHAALARLAVAITPTVINGVYPRRAAEGQARWLEENRVSQDAALYLARRRRQLAFVEHVASPGGKPVIFPYRFDGEPTSSVDRDALLGAILPEQA